MPSQTASAAISSEEAMFGPRKKTLKMDDYYGEIFDDGQVVTAPCMRIARGTDALFDKASKHRVVEVPD